MSIFSNTNIVAGASGKQTGYTIEESLRFNRSQSSYLSWTPASAGNRKTWTWSGWVKRGSLTGSAASLFSSRSGAEDTIRFDNINTFNFYVYNSGYVGQINTTSVYRDVSAWYHIVCVWDTTNATSTDRMRLYVNGERVSAFNTANYPSLNADSRINSNVSHSLGENGAGGEYFDGYITEVNFIDGQALDPSSFGEYDNVTGVWKPAEYTGSYGTNGFYLPMQLDNTVEGFNTVTYLGTGSTQRITGVGFQPDLVWIKNRNIAGQWHVLHDSVRGAGKRISSNDTYQEVTENALASFDTDGFTVTTGDNGYNGSSGSYVAWCWDAGSSTVSNTDGSITSSVRANPTYGFSVVGYTFSTAGTNVVGHGLGTTPAMIIMKSRTNAYNWDVYHQSVGYTSRLILNSTDASASGFWASAPTDTTFSVASNCYSNNDQVVAYCFSEVAGFSKFGSYTGTGASGNTVTTGFKPAFVMIKCTTTGGSNWLMFDTTRDTSNPMDFEFNANNSNQEYDNGRDVAFSDTSFTPLGNFNINGSGDSYIYMAFADTREYAYWLDDSGNNNDWQPNGGITTESTVTDTPTPYEDGGNYAVLNPLQTGSYATQSNGNLTNTGNTSTNSALVLASIGNLTSGKWYWEYIQGTVQSETCGITTTYTSGTSLINGENIGAFGIGARANGAVFGGTVGSITSWTTGDVIGLAVDCDNGAIYWSKNGVWLNSGVPTSGASKTGAVGVWTPSSSINVTPAFGVYNGGFVNVTFGQRPFAYTPPTGFKALHTGNLPDSAIVDGSKHFDALLYTGNGSTQSVTGLEFQPDFTWIKSRSSVINHALFDANRGVSRMLQSSTTGAEIYSAGNYLSSFDADGFTVQGQTAVNNNSSTFVAWNWKANGTGVSNTDGSITSTVSANSTAGFSIVTYTGNGISGATVGHGLGSAPDIYIIKNRSTTSQWSVKYTIVDGSLDYMFLESSAAAGNAGETAPTSSVINVWNGAEEGASGNNYVAYCFANVEGYSKFGSYTGNGSADGPFVYLGFRPAFVIIKKTSGPMAWNIHDSTRSAYNVSDKFFYANDAGAERVDPEMDLLSNGFKLRTTDFTYVNQSGGTYIYMAFAENPFKNSLAR